MLAAAIGAEQRFTAAVEPVHLDLPQGDLKLRSQAGVGPLAEPMEQPVDSLAIWRNNRFWETWFSWEHLQSSF